MEDISFSIAKEEVVVILGQSGCGKSTLLHILGGFEQADSGSVVINGDIVKRPSKSRLMLFQHYALLPWRTVLKNVEFGLEGEPLSRQERKEKAHHYLELVGLANHAHLRPSQLSGGMQQRVAIARAFIMQPEIILMDEPFSALDTFNRYSLQDELLRIQEQEKATIILVTHDIDEAIYLADRILIMQSNPGRIHKIISISTSKPRDRGGEQFQYYRKKILEEFRLSQSLPTVEFQI